MDAVAQLTAALAGRYAIDREIGRGGMATVFLARDVRHNRKVALKVLDPELGAVLGVERFLSEIQVTANLQHPNLLPLFDSGEANGLLFYVMPFVEGESLRVKLQREKQLPVEDAIRVATAVASALDYAHRHGVIHRDLKPENILMHDEQPVVADFGIALAVSNAGGNRITQTGLSLGTPQYMSPEQATGDREIDGRTDIYSLGAVTYEMLVGEPPHDGKTSQAIIARILTDRPRSMRLLRETVPLRVDAAVLRALAKLPADRFHSAREFADALSGQGFAATAPSAVDEAPPAVRPASRLWKVLPWAIAGVVVVAAAVEWRVAASRSVEPSTLRYEIALPPNVDVTNNRNNAVAISPGARYIAYIASRTDGTRRLMLRAADDVQPREVPGTEGAAFAMFSPDGASLAFLTNGQLLKVPVNGGKVEVIADVAEGASRFRGATWSRSGWIIVSNGTTLVKIPAVGGMVQPLTRLNATLGETGQYLPVALADGKTMLYTSSAMGGAANARIGVASITDGSTKILDLRGAPLGVLAGQLIYTTAAGTVMAAPFDLANRRITGPPLSLADQAALNMPMGMTYADMASDGSLAYVSGALRRQPVVIGLDGVPRPFGEPGPYSWPRLSPDGKRIAFSVGALSQRDVWLLPLPAGPLTRLTTEGVINDRPEWTPDGRAVVFRTNRRGRNALWVQPIDGGPAAPLFGRADSEIDEGVLSPDGQYLLLQRDSTGAGELWYRAMRGDTTLHRIVALGGYGGRFSPDGKWIVYASTESGTEQVYVRPFPSLANPVQVSLAGGGSPVWAPDGKRIYYVTGQQLTVATIGGTNPFTIASRAVALSRGYSFLGVHADYDVGTGGTVFAFQSPSGSTLVVVKNLASELRERVRGAPK